MIITWTPQNSPRIVSFSQPQTDHLRIEEPKRGVDATLDMSDAQVIVYAIPNEYRPYIRKARREDGKLHVLLKARYGPRNQLRDEVTREYGIGEVTW